VGMSAGTRLGPLLFITYVHDVPQCISPKFADDLAAVAVGEDIDTVHEQLQTAVDQLVDCAKQENMMLNAGLWSQSRDGLETYQCLVSVSSRRKLSTSQSRPLTSRARDQFSAKFCRSQ